MKFRWILALCFALTLPVAAQSTDNEPASRDTVILYLRTMHSHDMMKRILEVQSQSVQKLMEEQFSNEKGSRPSGFQTRMNKWMDDLLRNMPLDQITDAMIPAYQKHFTNADIEAMTAFYSSPVGQKVLEQLPEVMREGTEAMMPMLSKYLSDWKERMQKDMDEYKSSQAAPVQQESPEK